MAPDRSPYRVLGVDPSADPAVIAAAYRALARVHHPDVSLHPDAERRMAEINAAFAILRDPERRSAWDLEQGIARPAPRAGGTGSAGTRRGQAGNAGTVTWRRGPNGEGSAGPPPGRPGGSVLPFGRHIGWSMHEIARADPGYLAWLVERREGDPYREEIRALLASMRGSAAPAAAPPREATKRRGFPRR